MNLKIKKIALITLITISLSSLIFIFWKTSKSKTDTPISTEVFQRKLEIANYFEDNKFEITNNISKDEYNFPNQIPYLSLIDRPGLTQPEVQKIAANLGFTTEAIKFNDVTDGEVYIWNNETMSLIIKPKINHIQYTTSKSIREIAPNTNQAQLEGNSYKTIAEEFLSSKLNINPSSLFLDGFTYYSIEGGERSLVKSSKEQAQVVQLNYSSLISTIPIFTSNPDESQFHLQFLNSGLLFNFTGTIGLNYQNSPNSYQVKTFEEFEESLENSILVSLDDNNLNIPDVKFNELVNIQANSIKLVYLEDKPTQTELQPVFLVSGTALLQSKNVSVQFYLPAYSSITSVN